MSEDPGKWLQRQRRSGDQRGRLAALLVTIFWQRKMEPGSGQWLHGTQFWNRHQRIVGWDEGVRERGIWIRKKTIRLQVTLKAALSRQWKGTRLAEMDPSHAWEKPWNPCSDPTCHLFDPPKSTGGGGEFRGCVTMFQTFHMGDISKKGEGNNRRAFWAVPCYF